MSRSAIEISVLLFVLDTFVAPKFTWDFGYCVLNHIMAYLNTATVGCKLLSLSRHEVFKDFVVPIYHFFPAKVLHGVHCTGLTYTIKVVER